MYTKLFIAVMIISAVGFGCKKDNDIPVSYPPDVANAWMQMQIRFTRTTSKWYNL